MRIDCHNDTQLFLAEQPSLAVLPQAHLDYERLREYLDVAFFGLWVEQKTYAGQVTAEFRKALTRLRQDILSQGDITLLCHRKQLAHPTGPMILLGMEGAEPLEDDCALLDEYFAQGLRLIGPAWNYNTRYAGGAFEQGEITSQGEVLIRRCNAMGILLDGAHLNDGSFQDLLLLSEKPVIDSHTVCRHLCGDYPRSISDRQLEDLAEKGGVACMTMVPDFLGGKGDLAEFCRHVDYAVTLIGAEHVGIGADYDGTTMAEDLAGVQHLPAVYAGLRQRGLTDEQIAAVAGDSVARLLQEVLPEE